jgi:hypothetical protein
MRAAKRRLLCGEARQIANAHARTNDHLFSATERVV